MNLANLAIGGMQVAQNRLQTAAHNLNNAATEGYNRQSVVVTTAGARSTGTGWVGMGVEAVTVGRSYNGFLARQLLEARTAGAALHTYQNEINQVNNLLSDRTTGISPALQGFFDGLNAVASAPADPAARQELLGQAASLAGQINNADAFLEAQRGNINTQIATAVQQANSYLHRIHDLNDQIAIAQAASGHQPNDLLDQREQMLDELGQLLDITVLEQNGAVSLTIGNGQVLVGANAVFPLHAVPSPQDPSRLVLASSVPGAGGQLTPLPLPEDTVTGGNLGGLLRYRLEALDPLQNQLGRLAAGLALAVNRQHQAGFDLGGQPGQAFFQLAAPQVLAGTANQGGATLEATFVVPAGDQPFASPGDHYRVSFDGSMYTISTLDMSRVLQAVSLPLNLDGLSFNVSGVPQAGDSWLVQPLRNAASGFALALQQTDQIAAAATPVGDTDGGNALVLAQMQIGRPLAGGSAGFNEAYSQLVNKAGVLAQQNATASVAQQSLIKQNYAAQQAVSGVNIDEELALLERYQEQFRAAARLMDISASLFDTLLGIGR